MWFLLLSCPFCVNCRMQMHSGAWGLLTHAVYSLLICCCSPEKLPAAMCFQLVSTLLFTYWNLVVEFLHWGKLTEIISSVCLQNKTCAKAWPLRYLNNAPVFWGMKQKSGIMSGMKFILQPSLRYRKNLVLTEIEVFLWFFFVCLFFFFFPIAACKVLFFRYVTKTVLPIRWCFICC